MQVYPRPNEPTLSVEREEVDGHCPECGRGPLQGYMVRRRAAGGTSSSANPAYTRSRGSGRRGSAASSCWRKPSSDLELQPLTRISEERAEDDRSRRRRHLHRHRRDQGRQDRDGQGGDQPDRDSQERARGCGRGRCRTAGAFNHASTHGLNAIITRRLPKIAFLTTLGHRDMLDMARAWRPAAANTDPGWRRSFGDVTAPIVPRYLRRGIVERLAADGTMVVPLDEEQARTQLKVLARCKVEGVAICLLNAYVDGANERRLRELVVEELGDVACSISSEVSPLAREYARASTTTVDVLMKIIYGPYADRLHSGLTDLGFSGELNFADCAAMLAPVEVAMEQPSRIVFSGPAAGTVACAHLGKMIDSHHLLCADVGGTSCDISVVTDGEPFVNTTFELEHDLIVNTLSNEIVSVGAGGGSIVEHHADGGGQGRPRERRRRSRPGLLRARRHDADDHRHLPADRDPRRLEIRRRALAARPGAFEAGLRRPRHPGRLRRTGPLRLQNGAQQRRRGNLRRRRQERRRPTRVLDGRLRRSRPDDAPRAAGADAAQERDRAAASGPLLGPRPGQRRPGPRRQPQRLQDPHPEAAEEVDAVYSGMEASMVEALGGQRQGSRVRPQLRRPARRPGLGDAVHQSPGWQDHPGGDRSDDRQLPRRLRAALGQPLRGHAGPGRHLPAQRNRPDRQSRLSGTCHPSRRGEARAGRQDHPPLPRGGGRRGGRSTTATT